MPSMRMSASIADEAIRFAVRSKRVGQSRASVCRNHFASKFGFILYSLITRRVFSHFCMLHFCIIVFRSMLRLFIYHAVTKKPIRDPSVRASPFFPSDPTSPSNYCNNLRKDQSIAPASGAIVKLSSKPQISIASAIAALIPDTTHNFSILIELLGGGNCGNLVGACTVEPSQRSFNDV